jgi:hypothetical protein
MVFAARKCNLAVTEDSCATCTTEFPSVHGPDSQVSRTIPPVIQSGRQWGHFASVKLGVQLQCYLIQFQSRNKCI